jgi:hypothetical protein
LFGLPFWEGGWFLGVTMEDDGYWKDVEENYLEIVGRGVHYLTDDQVWELAKKLARDQYQYDASLDRAKREGRDGFEVLTEDVRRRRLEAEAMKKN